MNHTIVSLATVPRTFIQHTASRQKGPHRFYPRMIIRVTPRTVQIMSVGGPSARRWGVLVGVGPQLSRPASVSELL